MDSTALKTANRRLPDELIVEILSWLPAHTLWPLRCVCKPWLHLLTTSTDPHFAKLNYDRSIQLKTNPGIIALQDSKEDSFHLALEYKSCDKAIKLELPCHQKTNDCYLAGICNGLLCIDNDDNDELYIFNPITKCHITIPYTPTPSRFPGFEADTEFTSGFHQVINEYKVIKAFMECDNSDFIFHSQVSVYSLSELSWRTVVEDIPYNLCFSQRHCAVVDGVVHWLGVSTGSSLICVIVAFDLKDELFREVPPPKGVNFDDESCLVTMGELGGNLCVYCGKDEEFVVWEMKEYGLVSSWTKQFRIVQDQLSGCWSYTRPLGVVACIGNLIVRKNTTELILYHPKTNSISSLTGFGFNICNPRTYIGSIISPRAVSGARDMKAWRRHG